MDKRKKNIIKATLYLRKNYVQSECDTAYINLAAKKYGLSIVVCNEICSMIIEEIIAEEQENRS